jgi:hypothetical protein
MNNPEYTHMPLCVDENMRKKSAIAFGRPINKTHTRKKKKKKQFYPRSCFVETTRVDLHEVIMGEMYSGAFLESAKPAITKPQLATGPQNCVQMTTNVNRIIIEYLLMLHFRSHECSENIESTPTMPLQSSLLVVFKSQLCLLVCSRFPPHSNSRNDCLHASE